MFATAAASRRTTTATICPRSTGNASPPCHRAAAGRTSRRSFCLIVSAAFGPGGELGGLIWRGLDTRDLTQALSGIVLVVALAIVVDLIFRGLRRLAAAEPIEEVAA